MTWTTPADVSEQLRKLHARGDLARRVVCGEDGPVPIRLKKPTARDVASRLMDVAAWAEALRGVPLLVVHSEEKRSRRVGVQTLPQTAEFGSVWDAAKAARCVGDLRAVAEVADLTRERAPHLMAWLERKPLKALAVAAEWGLILDVHAWLREHPSSGIYARQLDLPGVHSKFVESHRALLVELSAASVDDVPDARPQPSGRGLAALGFRLRPERLRFRLLGNDVPALPGMAAADVTLDLATLATLPVGVASVLVVENEVTFLSLPDMPGTMAVWGAGYGVAGWGDVAFLQDARVLYWGDLDTHGFSILDQVRSALPHAESVLMDSATLRAFLALRSTEPTPKVAQLDRLTPAERETYDLLAGDALGEKVRLEQERIPLRYAMSRFREAISS